jgi:hypothetical protein
VSGRADFGKGSPADPMADAELEAKFRDCAVWAGMTEPDSRGVAASIWRIENVPDIRELTARLRVAAVSV